MLSFGKTEQDQYSASRALNDKPPPARARAACGPTGSVIVRTTEIFLLFVVFLFCAQSVRILIDPSGLESSKAHNFSCFHYVKTVEVGWVGLILILIWSQCVKNSFSFSAPVSSSPICASVRKSWKASICPPCGPECLSKLR